MTDRTLLVEGTRALLESLSNWLREVSVLDWDGTQSFLPIIRRSMLRRQYDSLDIAVGLVESNHGFAAVPLLRPACEELLWLRYFNQLSANDARELADCLISSGLLRDLEAQAGEVGEEEMARMGLLPTLTKNRSEEPKNRQRLRDLGERLSWPARTVNQGSAPSVWFVAQQSDSESLYRFLYHATSRYVHFSAVELARRGWGRPGRLEVSSDPYEPIWARFSLTWGTRLLGWTLASSLDALRAEGVPEPDHEALAAAFDRITKVPLVPLVTLEELMWDPSA
jgi:Family of unknown function (DUF5677)